jgi:hypothetical protein
MRGDNPLIHRIAVKDRDGRVIGEKEVIAYRGLLDMVHKERLREIRTTLLQAPSKDNDFTAIVHAVVRTSRGRFTGIGDANPRNVNAKIAPHLIRMAETRAEARAMRKAVNIGAVALEELGDDLSDDVTYEGAIVPTNGHARSANDNGRPATSNDVHATPVPNAPPPAPPPSSVPPSQRFTSDSRASDQQRKFVFRLLAERGVTGDAAREMIHKELGVTSLQDASRNAVSSFIDKIKANGHGQAEPGEAG